MTSSRSAHDPTAVVGRRFGAYVVDMLVLMTIVPAVVFFATADVTEYTGGPTCAALEAVGEVGSGEACITNVTTTNTDDQAEHSTVTFNKSALYLSGAIHLLYLVLVMWILQGVTGTTLGKAIFGIRTVGEAGGPPGIGRQLVRGVLWIVDGFILCGLPLIAIFTILISKGHRRVGDMVASTYVIGATDRGRPVAVAGAAAPVAANPYVASPPYAPPAASPAASPAAAPVFAAQPEEAPDQPAPGEAPTVITAPAAAPEPAAPEPAPAAAPDGPRWDPARNAYIYWDPARQAWLVHDAATGQWKPI